jgi:hypothetical protein
VKKCEANALVVVPEVGRALCRAAIMAHVPQRALAQYQDKLTHVRNQLCRLLRKRVM